MAQKVKIPYLETSVEKFQRMRGNGSSRMGCPTPTGSRTPVILLTKTDSSLPWESPSSSPLDDTLAQMREKEPSQTPDSESGDSTEIDMDLLQFWETRIPVRQK